MRAATWIGLFSVITVGAPAQTLHLVGPGGHAQIDDALAIASPGDVVQVQDGTYQAFTASIAVTIVALGPGTPTVLNLNGATHTVLQPPPGAEVHLVGLDFQSFDSGACVEVLGGRATFDRCEFFAREGDALVVDHAAAHLQDCSLVSLVLYGPVNALRIVQGDVSAAATAMSVLDFGFGSPGSRVVLVQASRLHATEFDASSNVPILVESIGSDVWISDSEMRCGMLSTGAPIRFSRSDVQPSPTFPTVPCTGFVTDAFQLGVTRAAPLQQGQDFRLDFRTEPNGFVAVFAAGDLATVALPPLLAQPAWLSPSSAAPVALLLADGLGDAWAQWNIPAAPGIANARLWFQGLSGWSGALHTSPVVGGVAR